MIAQLSHSEPLGSPSSSSSGVRCGRVLLHEAGLVLLPPHVHLLEVEPRGAHEDATDRLLTLGFRMLSVCVCHCSSWSWGNLPLDERDLYSLRCSVPHGTSSTSVWTMSASRSRSRIASASAGSAAVLARQLDADGERRLLLRARRPGLDEDVAADPGRERRDDLADRRREHVDAADDQHVVGSPDAAHARAGAPARARARCAPRRGRACGSAAAARARWRRWVSTSSPAAPSSTSIAAPRLRVDQLGVDEPARAEVHPVLMLALAPQRRRRCRRSPSPR